jgi:hypothetical protein
MNKRHELDPALVKSQIDSKFSVRAESSRLNWLAYQRALLSYEIEKSRADEAGGQCQSIHPSRPLIDNSMHLERESHSKVRVIELPKKGKRFVLVYGDEDDALVTSGTGPFETFETASEWFLKGGR